MNGMLIAHDDSVISRTAYLLEARKDRINLYRGILRGDPQAVQYQDVNKEEIRRALENEQSLLNGLIEDIEDRLFTPELQDIKREYLMGGEEMEASARKSDRPLIIIPEKHYAEAQSRLDAIRERNERSRLEYDCEKLKEGLINDFGVVSERTDLIPGKRYGRLRFSPTATAARNGKCIPYHGEIYLEVWWYCEDGVFHAENAWGTVCENYLPGCPMIEIE